MSGVRVLAAGAMTSIQDLGRHGWRHLGVPASGVLDPEAMQIANRLVGNAVDAPVLETFDGGLHLRVEGGPIRLALAGSITAERRGAGGTAPVAPWRSHLLAEGDELRLLACTGARRCAIVAIAGIHVADHLGSASTYVRAGLGGLCGRNLEVGDLVPASAADRRQGERRLARPPEDGNDPIRIVAGPQDDHFTAAALARLTTEAYRVGIEADRMGLRLAGPALEHRDAASREIVSDATVPGSIQVPGNGQPIVLLADGQTAGGYPKIATVISADLAAIGTLRPGSTVRFAWVDVASAQAIVRVRAHQLRTLLDEIVGCGDEIAPEAVELQGANLAGDAVNALDPRTWSA
ncbi:MAG: biotin-dependent carboxyltransferase family protein [Rhodocyclaceae bacterium]|nr:biotin-dependent carboxyltransferase family protein [Rhodocyclaceae bacterium]